jgi:hypothetical protein
MMIAGTLVLAGCRDTPEGLQQARDAIAAELPAPYFEDLVTESATIDGDRLVLLVRSPKGDAGKTRASPQFASLRSSEAREMRALCTHDAIRPLARTDAVLVRRFVDRNDALFFEVELPARECLAPPADAPATP